MTSVRVRACVVWALSASLAACGGAHTGTSPVPNRSAAPVASVSSEPPRARILAVPPLAVPHVDTSDLPNQVHVAVIHRDAFLDELRVAIESGSASDGAHPGLADVSARAVARAYAAEAKADPRAAPAVTAGVGPDSAVFATRVAPDGLGPTLAAMGRAISKPRADAPTVRLLDEQVATDALTRARDVETVGWRFAVRDLFLAPVGRHPYSIVLPTADEVRAIDDKLVRSYLDTHYVARNVAVVVVGPSAPEAVGAAAGDGFGKLSVGAVGPLTLDPPDARPAPLKIMLVDDPKQDPVILTIAELGPSIGAEEATVEALAGEISATRLAAKAGGSASFRSLPFRQSGSLTLLEARVPALAIQGAVVALAGDGEAWTAAPTADEVVSAKNKRRSELARTLDSPPALADALVRLAAADAPEATLEKEDLEISAATPADIAEAGRAMRPLDRILVVVGAAAAVADPLSDLGIVDVLDPAQGFTRVRSLPKRSTTPVVPVPPLP